MKIHHHLLSDVMWVILVPPIITFAWLLFSRGLTNIFGTSDNKAVQGWTKSGFWIVLILSYVVSIGMFVYAYFIRA
jgi:hypothetical protein